MLKNKLLDKFSYAIIFTFSWTVVQIYKNNDSCFFVLISSLTMLILLGLVAYFKNEQYIQDFITENGNVEVIYQNNFEKDNTNRFTIILKNVKSVDFKSKSFTMRFHLITIKAVDENGLHYLMEFKTNNDAIFIKLLGLLKNIN